jgi:hypothetical protein
MVIAEFLKKQIGGIAVRRRIQARLEGNIACQSMLQAPKYNVDVVVMTV